MSTGIEWTDETWNPVTGCTKVSQGCKNCYAERIFARPYPGRSFTDVRTHPDRLDHPLRWKKPKRIFVNSMSDLFHDDVPDEFIERVLTTTVHAQQHTFQILTKRPKRMLELMRRWSDRNGRPQSNLWLGVSVEDQDTADERIPLLLQTPAAVRFLSCEPLLGPINLTRLPGMIRPEIGGQNWLWAFDAMRGQNVTCRVGTSIWAPAGWHGQPQSKWPKNEGPRINWVIAGGESGPKARPSHPDWFRTLRDQCAAASVPFFFKQWGEFAPTKRTMAEVEASPIKHVVVPASATELYPAAIVDRVGKKAAGRTLDGREHMEYPA